MVNRFLDRTNKTGDLTGTWNWTATSTAVTAVAASGDAINDGLVAGDYIKSSAKLEWYKVATVTDKDNLILSYAYAEATENGATIEWSDLSVEDGTTAAKAFCHVLQYTQDEARGAADILQCRRGQTHTVMGIIIEFDEDGTVNAPIVIQSDDGTGWIAEIASANTIFDFGATTKQLKPNLDNYWDFKDLEFNNGANNNGSVAEVDASYGIRFIGCEFSDMAGGGSDGVIYLNVAADTYFESCIWNNNPGRAIRSLYGGSATIIGCTIDGQTTSGFRFESGFFLVSDTDMGVTTTNVTDLVAVRGARVICRNVVLNSGIPYELGQLDSTINIQDYDSTQLDNRKYNLLATILRDVAHTRVGGADTAIKVEPLVSCGAVHPALCYETWVYNAGAEATYTIWMDASGAWGALPANTELWVEVAYFDGADGDRATVVSTDVIAVEGTWKDFDVTCTPAAAGPVRLRVWLSKYEAGNFIHIDQGVVVS